MKNDNNYSELVSSFFRKHLAGTKDASVNTIFAYRDAFIVFNDYLVRHAGFKLEKMGVTDLSRGLILDYLSYLDTERGYSASSRNHRLAALKSFARYVQVEAPEAMNVCQAILAIESKNAAKPIINYLNTRQTDLLMEQPDLSRWKGRRDLALLLLMYDSAARAQEICNLKVDEVRLTPPALIRVLGKGRKSRDIPISAPCAKVLQQYIQENHLDRPECAKRTLFVNPQGTKLTRSGISYVLSKYVKCANNKEPNALPDITPHCLRHSKAMHLVEAQTNLIYIRDFLGHESVETTQVYAKANPEARRKAIEAASNQINTPGLSDWNDDPDITAFLKSL